MKLAGRLDHIEPFYVMECAKAAAEIARSPACDPALGGRRMIYLNIGEPDFSAPPAVQAAAQACIESGMHRCRVQHAQQAVGRGDGERMARRVEVVLELRQHCLRLAKQRGLRVEVGGIEAFVRAERDTVHVVRGAKRRRAGEDREQPRPHRESSR